MKRILLICLTIALAVPALAYGYFRLTTPLGWGPRLERSGLDRVVFEPGLPFADYLDRSKALSARLNARRIAPFPDDQLSWRQPFEFFPSDECIEPRGGVLMVHGLTDSPATMTSLGQVLAQNCWHVRGIALPGHGTTSGELIGVTLDEFSQAVRYGLYSFQKVTDGPVWGAGLSTGVGLLFLQHQEQTAQDPVKLAGIIGLSSGLSGPIELSPITRALAPLMWSMPRFRYPNGVLPDDNPGRYQSSPQSGLIPYVDLQTALYGPDAQARFSLPAFFAHSGADATVPAASVIDFFCSRLAGPKQMILYDSDQAACAGINPRQVEDPRFLSLGHVGITNAPDHPVFGEQGYQDCRHYFSQGIEAWNRCKASGDVGGTIFYGEESEATQPDRIVRRATYNPDFDRMAEEILSFMAENTPPAANLTRGDR